MKRKGISILAASVLVVPSLYAQKTVTDFDQGVEVPKLSDILASGASEVPAVRGRYVKSSFRKRRQSRRCNAGPRCGRVSDPYVRIHFPILYRSAAVSTSRPISEAAKRIAREEFGLEKMTVRIREGNVAEQNRVYRNKVGFEQAMREALKSFLENPEDAESPLALAIEEAYGEFSGTPAYPELLAKAKEMLREWLNDGEAVIDLLGPSHMPPGWDEVPGGEDLPEWWIFILKTPISDHMHWAVVHRQGKEPTANYGFN